MKNNRLNMIGRTAFASMLVLLAAGACFAQLEKRSSGGGRLEGTWDAVVTLRNCESGDPIRSFASIGTFMRSGTSIGSTSGLPQASRTPEHGVWRHVSENVYEFKFKSFGFDVAGNPTGWTIVTHQVELSADANTYTSGGIAQFFLLNGVQVGQGCSIAVGTRFGF